MKWILLAVPLVALFGCTAPKERTHPPVINQYEDLIHHVDQIITLRCVQPKTKDMRILDVAVAFDRDLDGVEVMATGILRCKKIAWGRDELMNDSRKIQISLPANLVGDHGVMVTYRLENPNSKLLARTKPIEP